MSTTTAPRPARYTMARVGDMPGWFLITGLGYWQMIRGRYEAAKAKRELEGGRVKAT
jgi:hypothetical protein